MPSAVSSTQADILFCWRRDQEFPRLHRKSESKTAIHRLQESEALFKLISAMCLSSGKLHATLKRGIANKMELELLAAGSELSQHRQCVHKFKLVIASVRQWGRIVLRLAIRLPA